jgi:hypothetical protein
LVATAVWNVTWFSSTVSAKLRFGDRRGHLQQRLAGEHHPALRDRLHVAGEPQAREPAQGVFPVAADLAQVAQIIGGE